MGRYVGPVCRLCRRERTKLFLKGERCYMLAKCPVDKGRGTPGMHHSVRRGKLSDYGLQLREKQKLRRMYGLQESQFRNFFKRALKGRGVTGEKLLQSLELRLDNIVYRAGFAPSRRAARQFVRHGHIALNGHKTTIPSIVLRAGDIVEVRDRKQSREYAQQCVEAVERRSVIPSWLKWDKENLRCEVLRIPTREDIQPIVEETLIVEFYSK